MSNNITLQVYGGAEASVNAYIFSDAKSIILVDCLRNSEEAKLLAATIKEHRKRLTHLLITHGHPDHYIGMNVIKGEFPGVQIVVARQEIKDDIIGFSNWMESVGWLEKEPAMKSRSRTNTTGFDYQNHITVLNSGELQLAEGAVLELNSDYKGAECTHLTTMFSKDLDAFFTGDFCYNGVHLWLAVDKESIVNWKAQLEDFIKIWNREGLTVYPGHGKKSDVSLFQQVITYIEDFERTVATAKNHEEAMQQMKTLYPDHQQADFLLFYSINAFVAE